MELVLGVVVSARALCIFHRTNYVELCVMSFVGGIIIPPTNVNSYIVSKYESGYRFLNHTFPPVGIKMIL